MAEELLINNTAKETRIAVLEKGILQDIYIERETKQDLVGNIYKGKVVRVLPGMQAAFIDIGLERAAFLHVGDMHYSVFEQDIDEERAPLELIHQRLTEGQEVIVQVIKDPIQRKGARLTTEISLPSRYLVFMPGLAHIGVSLRIEGEDERNRLKSMLLDDDALEGGYIIRTAAEGIKDLSLDKTYLQKVWKIIQQRVKKAKCGDLLYEELPLVLRLLRDLISPDTKRVCVDNEEQLKKAEIFIQNYVQNFQGTLEFYEEEVPLFDAYHIEDEIQKALQRTVQLKSGGYLVFDQTEAMTTIDVNTGAFVGKRNLEETVFKTNLEAAACIARQLRLRNIGGIIIIDFIDMLNEEHKEQVLRTLERELGRDSLKTTISEVSALGLVQMTRKRTHESLAHYLCEQCPTCQGRGKLKTAETVCYEIYREVYRLARCYPSNDFLVLASQSVVDRLLDEESAIVLELQDDIQKNIKFQVEALYTQEQYDVVLT